MIVDNEIDIKLLEYLSEESSLSDSREVEQWIELSAENRLYFERFRRDYLLMRWTFRSQLIRGFDFDRIRKRLRHKLSLPLWSRIAAVAVFLLGGGLASWLVLSPDRSGQPGEQVTAIIEPGKPQATLVLSSGMSVPISAVNTELKEEDGTSIKIDDSGEVCYKSDQSTGPEAVAPVYNMMQIPRGGEFALSLDDGTKVWLNSDTELKYPVRFAGGERLVYLRGEAYFKVAKDTRRAFIVVVDDIRVKVFGTEFNVNTHNEGEIETVLVEGSVGVGKDSEILLKPSEKAEYVKTTGDINVQVVDVLPYIAWKDGSFIFQQENLGIIMEKLTLWYDIEVCYENENLKNIRLSGDMKRYKEINDLLYFFEKSSDAIFRIEGRTVFVSKRG